MFEAIAISSRSAPGRDFEIADLAESLLYYGHVHMVGGAGLIAGLVGSIGTLQLIELIERGYLSIQFEREMVAISTHKTPNGREFHEIVTARPQNEPEAFIQRALIKAGWEKYQAKIKARRLAKFINEFSFEKYSNATARRLILDPRAGLIVQEYLEQFGAAAAVPSDFKFHVNDTPQGLVVDTNLNFDAATAAYRQAHGYKIETVTPALVLDALRQAFDQQYVAATLDSEVRANSVVLAASSLGISDALRTSSTSDQQISSFQEFVFEGVGSVGSVLTTGKRTFDDFLKVLRRAESFRSWVAQQQPDADLLKEYHRSIARESFLETFPGKVTRFAIFTGGGLAAHTFLGDVAGVAAAAGIGAADTFLADKLRAGWKPHHFVTGPLRSFVVKAEASARE